MFRWLDIIDQQQLQNLLHSHNLQLTHKTRQFLESFARLVNKANTTHTRLITTAQKRHHHLQTVNTIIAEEVSQLQQTFQNFHIIPYRHPETSLPIVYTRLPHAPDLVVHVYRSYAESRTDLAFGFRAYSFCRGQLTGPIARAANYLRAKCTATDWKLSLTQLVTLWCHQIQAIPLDHRISTPKPTMLRRRRGKSTVSSDDPQHTSIPQNHPKTDVVIKDDKLFPNRTFDDPEQLYAEQVRAIRKKRKPVPGVLDDYELAKKKRSRHDQTGEHPSEHLKPTPQPSSAHPTSVFTFHSSDNPKADTPQAPPDPHSPPPENTPKPPVQPPVPRTESPEEPEFTFHNPLSPEQKDSSPGETPSPTDHPDNSQPTDHGAAMEAAERAVLSKPAQGKIIPSVQNDHHPVQEPDDGGPSMFFFSTAMEAHVPPVAEADDVVRDVVQEEPGLVFAASDQKEEPLAILPPPVTEKTDVVIAPPEVTQSQEEGPTLSAEEDGESGRVDEGGIDRRDDPVGDNVDPVGDFVDPAVDSVDPVVDNVDPVVRDIVPVDPAVDGVDKVDEQTPKTADEDYGKEGRQVQADGNDPEDIDIPDNSKQSLPSKTVSETLDKVEAQDMPSKRDTTGITPPANTGHLSDSSLETPKPKKRTREMSSSEDVIIVDPDPEEDNEKNPKKRRLSSSPGSAKPFTPPQEKNLLERPSPRNVYVSTPDRTVPSPDRTVPSPDRTVPSPDRTVPSPDRTVQTPELTVRSPERTVRSPERTVGSPERTVRSPERTARSPEKDSKKMSAREVVRPRIEKTVTPDVEIPAGVDCDPCPMALSEPESSDYSSDHNSNSDAGSISDVEHGER